MVLIVFVLDENMLVCMTNIKLHEDNHNRVYYGLFPPTIRFDGHDLSLKLIFGQSGSRKLVGEGVTLLSYSLVLTLFNPVPTPIPNPKQSKIKTYVIANDIRVLIRPHNPIVAEVNL